MNKAELRRKIMAAAMNFVNNSRNMKNIERKPCFVCGTNKSLYKHHEDYSKPLEVVFYCQKHHKERHAEMRRLNISPWDNFIFLPALENDKVNIPVLYGWSQPRQYPSRCKSLYQR